MNHRTRSHRTRLLLHLVLLPLAAVFSAASPAPAQDAPQGLRYLQVGERGAQARNLYDKSGLAVGELAKGTILAVHAERGEWLQVEVPGGFAVWVFGQYVKPTSQPGVLEVTGNEVRQRPLPSSGDNAYPLSPNLARGERVTLVRRNDPSLPLERDWVQIYSPPGVRAWVPKADTQALPAGSDGAELWAAAAVEKKQERTPAAAKAPVAVPAAAPAQDARAAGTGGQGQAAVLLREADELLARERELDSPDFAAVRAAYGRALAADSSGPTAEIVRSRLKEVDAYAEFFAIRSELEAERARRQSESERRQQALEQAAGSTDPFAGRYDARGWLERRKSGKTERFVVVWSGKEVAEVVCTSKRYDLGLFENYQVGVNGFGSNAGLSGGGPIDVARLEVLAGRYKSR
jgi:hypothetical protein